jgi:hypothetical protein
MSGIRRRSSLSPGCRDRLALASSLATILALLVGLLGLARAMLNVTLPVRCSADDPLCARLFAAGQPDLTSSMLAAARRDSPEGAPAPTASLDVTLVPSPAATSQPPPATATPTAVVSETAPITVPTHLMQAPVLVEPSPDAPLDGQVRFQWHWDGEPLTEGLAFDLLIWSEAEDEEHRGARALGVIEPARILESDVDLDYVQSIMDHGGGRYYWTVIVVEVEPYERVGLWGEKRGFTYALPEAPAEPPSP